MALQLEVAHSFFCTGGCHLCAVGGYLLAGGGEAGGDENYAPPSVACTATDMMLYL